MKAITTVGEWLRLIKEWQQSGLTVSEWCRRNGIHPNTFCKWIHRSRKQGLLETPAVIPQPAIQDPIQQDKIKADLGWYPETPFEVGIVKTIDWYLENEEWMERVTSGDYQKYYETMYKGRQ